MELRIQRERSSPDYELLRFVKDYPLATTKEMVIEALRAFWLPLACQKSGRYDREQIRELGRQAISCLQGQIEHLIKVLELSDLKDNRKSDLASLTRAGAATQLSLNSSVPLPPTQSFNRTNTGTDYDTDQFD
uniref:Uncharacterized protein n=2 Tax=Gloeothece TaxID=28070 RepID=E0UNR3_GLOV7|nr:hypothetical protein Cyan7822_6955 [Gloeothece verrucosa PCC 7822]